MEENNIIYDYIIHYLRQTLPLQKGKLAQIEQKAKDNDIPIVHIEVIRFLYKR